MSTTPTTTEAIGAAFEHVAAQAARVAAAKDKLRREEERLDDVVANAVSSKPDSRTWYASPGTLTQAKAREAADMTELALDRALGRYRAAVAAKAKAAAERKPRRRSTRPRR